MAYNQYGPDEGAGGAAQPRPTQQYGTLPNVQPQGPASNPPPAPDAPSKPPTEAEELGYTGVRKDESTFGGEGYQRDWDPGWVRQLRKRALASGKISEEDLDPAKLYDPEHRRWLNKKLKGSGKGAGAETEAGAGTGTGEGEGTEGTGGAGAPGEVPEEPLAAGSREQIGTISGQLAAMFPSRGGFESEEITPGGIPPGMPGGEPEPQTGGTDPMPEEPGKVTSGMGETGGFIPPWHPSQGGTGRPEGGDATTRSTGAGDAEGQVEGIPEYDPNAEIQTAGVSVLTRPPHANKRALPSFYTPTVYTGGM